MSRLPVVSGAKLVRFLSGLGYRVVRQRGSHVRLEKIFPEGRHAITVPAHAELARGTLNDVLRNVSELEGIPRRSLIDMLTGKTER